VVLGEVLEGGTDLVRCFWRGGGGEDAHFFHGNNGEKISHN